MSRKSEMLKEIKERSAEELRNIVERAGRDEVTITDMLGFQSENFLSKKSIQKYIDNQDCAYYCSKRKGSTLVNVTGHKARHTGRTKTSTKVYVNVENDNDRIEVTKSEVLYRFQ